MMNQNTETSFATEVPADTDLIEHIRTSLEATGRLPCPPPATMFEIYMTRDNIEHLYIDEVDGGWVGNITFHNVPPGCANSIGTPDAQPFPTRQQAFLAGARIVCDLFTGSRDLPFFACGDTLITVAYRT